MSNILLNILIFIVMILTLLYLVKIMQKEGLSGVLNNIGTFLFSLFIMYIMFFYIPDLVINRDEYKQQAIQDNTQTVLIDDQECVIYDDGGLFGSPSIDCEWGENK